MQGSITVKTKLPLNREESGFSLSSKLLPGNLIKEFHILIEAGALGEHFIYREGFLLIQQRKVQEEDYYYIHPYGTEEVTGFETLGEAVGVLINEIIEESNV